MEYHETTKIDSYENYNEGNPNAHPRENRWQKCGMFTVVYYAESYWMT